MIKNDNIQLGDSETPIVGAGYSWQGLPVAVLDVMPSSLSCYKYDVVVEYFDKVLGKWTSLLTPWLPGSFTLTFKPGGNLW